MWRGIENRRSRRFVFDIRQRLRASEGASVGVVLGPLSNLSQEFRDLITVLPRGHPSVALVACVAIEGTRGVNRLTTSRYTGPLRVIPTGFLLEKFIERLDQNENRIIHQSGLWLQRKKSNLSHSRASVMKKFHGSRKALLTIPGNPRYAVARGFRKTEGFCFNFDKQDNEPIAMRAFKGVAHDLRTEIESRPAPGHFCVSRWRQPSRKSLTWRLVASTMRNPVILMAPYSITSLSQRSSIIWLNIKETRIKWYSIGRRRTPSQLTQDEVCADFPSYRSFPLSRQDFRCGFSFYRLLMFAKRYCHITMSRPCYTLVAHRYKISEIGISGDSSSIRRFLLKISFFLRKWRHAGNASVPVEKWNCRGLWKRAL